MNLSESFKKTLPLGLALALTFTGCLTDSDDEDDEISTKTVQMGAQGNTAVGSFLDADDMSVFLVTDGPSMGQDIDLIFAFSTSQTAASLYSPHAAKAGIGGSAGFDFVQGLDARTTEIRTITASTFADLSTQQDLQDAWDQAVADEDGRVLAEEGGTIMIRTNENKLVAIQVTQVVQGPNGTVTLMGRARF